MLRLRIAEGRRASCYGNKRLYPNNGALGGPQEAVQETLFQLYNKDHNIR